MIIWKFHDTLSLIIRLVPTLFMNEVPVIFLGVQIDKNLNWKSPVVYILPKLSSAIFVIRSLSYFMSTKTLGMVYFSIFTLFLNME
jgi:hypothetical protein